MIALIAAAVHPDARANTWPHAVGHTTPLTWVHPLANYAVHPTWQRDWERHLLQGSGVQTTVGSVSTSDFATTLTVNLDQPLRGRFRFLYRGTWLGGNHRDEDLTEHWLGMEMRLTGPVGLHLQAHPTPNKEVMDVRGGFTLADAARERYLRLSLRADDFVYERKNHLDGESESETLALEWEARWAGGRWEVFTAGMYGSPSRRRYDDPVESPHLATAYRDHGGSTFTVRRLLADDDFVALGMDHADFAAAESWYDREAPYDRYDYHNEWLHLRAQGVLRTADAFGLRPELHWVRQWSRSSGRWDFDLDRTDFFPALFGEWRAADWSTWELGYMACHHRWDYTNFGDTSSVDDYTDKVKLGWTCAFTPTAILQLSISHEIDLQQFGGGNVQFQTLF